MPEDTSDFNIEPDGGMTPPAEFTYNGHQVEIVPPDAANLIGNYWQIKIDGVSARSRSTGSCSARIANCARCGGCR